MRSGIKFFLKSSALFVALCTSVVTNAKDASKNKKHVKGAIYASWGYNQEWYTQSTIHVNQSSLGNDYQLVKVNAHDHKGWDETLFHAELTIPQYNYRLGYYFNEKQDLAFEINFDHTKYIITDGQQMQIKGMFDGKAVDYSLLFARDKGFYYFLNNGANFLLFNLVKRFGLYHTNDNNLRFDLTAKAGVGPVVPHVENSLFGKANQPHFQVGGWNTGVETALRMTVCRYGFLEFSQKVDYARYSHLKIYEGTAKHSFGTYELILSAGFILPTGKHNPMFEQAHSAAEQPSAEGK